MSVSRKLTLEHLEDRLTPSAWGNVWPNPGHLTLSFAADGTGVNSGQSSLFQSLNTIGATAAWQQEILRAFQTWAVNSNINIGVVGDGGQALGSSGAVQGDSRFGDFRIAMLNNPTNVDVADTAGFDLAGSTWNGDMLFNGQYGFGIKGAGQYDLFSVALHEASHSFGFADQATDPTSAMYAGYVGARTGLSSSDIAALQTLYGGPRKISSCGNNSFATALNLAHPDQSPVASDISSATAADFYSFTTPAAAGTVMKGMTATTSFTVQLQAAGISLLESNVTVFDAAHNVVGSGSTTNPLANNVTVQINNAKPSTTYFVQVTGAAGTVFGIGSYQMSIKFPTSTVVTTSSSSTTMPANNSMGTAQVLSSIQMSANGQGFTYSSGGNLTTAGQGDYYQVVAPALPSGGQEMLTVTAASIDTNGLRSTITVFDGAGNVLPCTVINNGNGTFTVQLGGITAGTNFYLEVNAPAGVTQNVGKYSLTVQFNNDAATTFSQLASATISQSTVIGYQSMAVAQGGVVQFNFSADVGASTVSSAVRMTIYDQNNNQVFTSVAFAGQGPSTGFNFLSAGSYTVRFNAATQAGAPMPDIAWTLGARRLSDPLDPVTIDPTAAPTGASPSGISVGASTGGGLATLPVVDPYSNPTTGPAPSSPSPTTVPGPTTTSTTTTVIAPPATPSPVTTPSVSPPTLA